MTIDRRRFLATGIVGIAAACSTTSDDAAEPQASTPSDTDPTPETPTPESSSTTEPEPTLVDSPPFDGDDPFLLGVASGDPDPNSVVLWTRLITAADTDLEVALDIGRDDAFEDLVSSRDVTAVVGDAHSIHALATELDPDTWYSYRFRVGSHVSATGRARTIPDGGMSPVRFAFSSCQNWEQGTYAAHRHLADEELDLFIWLGDYIYESGPNDQGVSTTSGARIHDTPEVTDLDAYRARYVLYKSDPWLQANHAARPWIITWDDHEVDNDHAASTSEDGQDPASFDARRRAAYKAWWEHQPVRIPAPSAEPDEPFVIHRTQRWGELIDFHVLDGRQYRDPQPRDDTTGIAAATNLPVAALGPASLDPNQSMLGMEQRQWLIDEVQASTATWSTLANQVYMHGINALPGDTPTINPDSWDGYAGERQVLLSALAEQATNLIVLTGDFHAATVAELRADPFDTSLPVIGTEFMAPAISSRFPEQLVGLAPIVVALNTQVQHFEPRNGFMICAVDKNTWSTSLHSVVDTADEMSAVEVTAMFAVNAGTPSISTTIETDG